MSRMSAKKIAEWMAFAQLEPFGFEANMTGFGIVASTVANVNRKKGSKAYKPDDFIPKPRTRVSGQGVWDAFKSWALAQGAKRVKRGNGTNTTS